MTVGCTIHMRPGEVEIAVTVGTKESAPLVSVSFALSTDDESESGGCWLHPGVSPPGDAVLQLDDESNSVLESGCMFSSKNHCIKR